MLYQCVVSINIQYKYSRNACLQHIEFYSKLKEFELNLHLLRYKRYATSDSPIM